MTEQTRTGTDRTILLAGAILVGGLGWAMMVQQQQMRRAISTHRTMADELLAGLAQLDAILGPPANENKPAPSMNGAARVPASSREASAGDNHDTAPGAPPLA